MSAIPAGIETERGPPTWLPLRHFVVGLGFLVLAGTVGVGAAVVPGWPTRIAHLHLALVGWVCLTIMGAMTQFVPVWSGVGLYSRRLSNAALRSVTAGLLGFVASLAAGRFGLLVAFAALLLAGIWIFVYAVGRTLAAARPFDATERRFALALGFFAVLAPLGFALALDLSTPLFPVAGIGRGEAVAAHATLAVFGAVTTTVLGALGQLAPMFTGTELRGVDRGLRRFEGVAYPVGVVALALGRLVAVGALAAAGGLLVVAGLLAFAAVLARRLYESRVEPTPTLRRYAVAAAATALWGVATAPAWATRPLAPDARLGAPGTAHLLGVGVIGFVVIGTLYHVVPFVVWIGRYSDRLGYERVPMIDDLYRDRIAGFDLAATLSGTTVLVAADALDLPEVATPLGGTLATIGFLAFVANLALTLREHGPYTIVEIVGVGTAGGADAE